MDPAQAAQALARASSVLTRSHDVAGSLADLLDNSMSGLDVEAAGILVEADGRLELLASSSHQATELEMHQLHTDEGPCIDAHADNESLQVHSAEALLDRWPAFARTMLDAGFESVHATPLVWQGAVYGAMGLFRRADREFTPEEDVVARAFADLAMLYLLRLEDIEPERLSRQLAEALETRVLLERAKGVLADTHHLSMADAYERLVETARDRRVPLTEWAARVVDAAQSSS